MRRNLQLALLPFLLWTAIAAAAEKARIHDDDSARVLLSTEQGQGLVEFALESGASLRPKPDCSHLVHLLYSRAGLNYPYERSRVLYRGVPDFERVKRPQPGDLIVWLGHVGIVVSPEEKTFFSSVRSGIITESWTADHWLARGRPRFFRYRMGPATNPVLLAALVRNDGGEQKDRESDITVGERTTAQISSGTAAQPSPMKHKAISMEPSALATRTVNVPRNELDTSDIEDSSADSNSIVAVIHQSNKPNKQQIAAAVLESGNAGAHKLSDDGRLLDLDRPLSVIARLEVEKIKIKHESGSIVLKFSETMSLESGKVVSARTTERELSIYRRNDTADWVISDPRERTYVPQAQALGLFQSQAQLFLRRTPNSDGTRAMIKALDVLYDQQSGIPQRDAEKYR